MSKLVAGREKDHAFAAALIRAGLISTDVLLDRVGLLEAVHPTVPDRLRAWIAQHAK